MSSTGTPRARDSGSESSPVNSQTRLSCVQQDQACPLAVAAIAAMIRNAFGIEEKLQI